MPFLRLIRIRNLLIIAFTQYMVRYCLLLPLAIRNGYHLQMGSFQFFLLSLSTVMIAAAGYIINDYFDVRIDKVNKPERLVIDKGVKRRVAIGAHTVINVLAVFIGLVVSWRAGAWKLVSIHLICATGLWFYSTTFKRKFFIGNLVIAAFTALVPLVPGIYELFAYYRPTILGESFRSSAWTWVLMLSFFAFITTLLREIIKDIEDYEGDKEFGCRTLPIVIGIRAAKNVVITITFGTIFSLALLQITAISTGNILTFFYFLVMLQLPLIYLAWKIKLANTKKEFYHSGQVAKLIMLSGVCYLFLFAYITLQYEPAFQ